VFDDITIKRAANPIFINTTRRLRTPEKVGAGRVRNVVIRNVTVTDVEQTHNREPPNAATISGVPEAPHENILLENVTITYPGGGTVEQASLNPPYPTDYNPRMLGPRPAYGFYVRHVRGLVFRNVKVGFQNADPRPAFAVSRRGQPDPGEGHGGARARGRPAVAAAQGRARADGAGFDAAAGAAAGLAGRGQLLSRARAQPGTRLLSGQVS
jgi:hypothetical protein